MDKKYSLFAFVAIDGYKDLRQIYVDDFSSKRAIADFLIAYFDSFDDKDPIVSISKSFFSCLNKSKFFKSYKSNLGYMSQYLPSHLLDLTPIAFISSLEYIHTVRFFVKCAM